jgi:hypothetical protein
LITQLLGHTGHVTALAGSSLYVWSASGDQSVRAWDPETGQLQHVLTGHNCWVRCVLAVDEFVWSGGDDASIKVWHQQSGRLELDLRGHTAAVHCLLRVGLHVWSGGADKVIRIWAAQGGRLVKELRGHESWINALVLREPFVWSASSDRTIRLWNAASGACFKVLRGHTGWVWSLAGVGPERVWSGSGDKTIRVWRDFGVDSSGPTNGDFHARPQTLLRAAPATTAPKKSAVAATAPATTATRARSRPVVRRRAEKIDDDDDDGDDNNNVDERKDDFSDDEGTLSDSFANHSWLADRRRRRTPPRTRGESAGMHALRTELSALRQQLIPPPPPNVHSTPFMEPAAAYAPGTIYAQPVPPQQYSMPPVFAVPPAQHLFNGHHAAQYYAPQAPAPEPVRQPTLIERDASTRDGDLLAQRKRELAVIESTLLARREEARELELQLLQDAEREQVKAAPQPAPVPVPQQPAPQPQEAQPEQVELLRTEKRQLQHEMQLAHDENRRLGEQVLSGQRQCGELTALVEQLRAQLALADRERSAQANELRALRDSAKDTRAADELKSLVQQLRDELAAGEQERGSLRDSLRDVRSADDRKDKQIEDLQRALSAREASLSAARESVAAARERISTLEAELVLTERHVAAAQQRAADDSVVFEQRIAAAEARARELASKLDEHTHRAAAVEEAHRVLSAAFADAVAQQRELEAEVEKYAPLEAEVEMLRSKLDALRQVAHTVRDGGNGRTPLPARSQAHTRQRGGDDEHDLMASRLKLLLRSAAASPAAVRSSQRGNSEAVRQADAARVERLNAAKAKLQLVKPS